MNKHNNITKGDVEHTTLTTEVLEVAGKSCWCTFCGDQYRNKCKRDTCDTYEAVDKIKAPRGLKKGQNKLALNIIINFCALILI